MPHWARTASVAVNGRELAAEPSEGWLTVTRSWSVGDELVLELPLEARFTRADSRVDADRGSVALERGPLVYCVEACDNPGLRLDDVVVDPASPPRVGRPDPSLPDEVLPVVVQGRRRPRPDADWWPYSRDGDHAPRSDGPKIELTAVPYFAWGNRAAGAMRVWIPAG